MRHNTRGIAEQGGTSRIVIRHTAVGVIKTINLAGKRFAQGNMARVEVIGVRTLKSRRVIVELKPGTKRENR